MKDVRAVTNSISEEILSIRPGGAAAYVQQKIHDRAFHGTVSELNNEYLFGSPQQRENARLALARLGFAEV